MCVYVCVRMKLQRIHWYVFTQSGSTLCQSVAHLACSPGRPQQNTYKQSCLLSVSNNEPLCHLIWQLRSLPASTACSLLCWSTWVKMEFLGAHFTSWFTLQQQLADAFMIRTTKLEPEKGKAGDRARVKKLEWPSEDHLWLRAFPVLSHRANKAFVSKSWMLSLLKW